MAETSVNGQLSQEEQCSLSTDNTMNDNTKAFDKNKNSKPSLKHVQTLEDYKNEEASNESSKIYNLSPELRDDSKFDAKEAEKNEICESKVHVDSLSSGDNTESSVLNHSKEENGTKVQKLTSSDDKHKSVAKESFGQESVDSSLYYKEEQKKETESKVEQTKGSKESDISCETTQKEEQYGCQTIAVAENETAEEITNTIEGQKGLNALSTDATPMEIEHTESFSVASESTVETKLENTTAAVEKKDEGIRAAENSSRFEPNQAILPQASSSVWYTDESEKEAAFPKPEGYSTTVIGGVIVRKPLPSSSSPERKRSSPVREGSARLRMSWESIFGKKKSSKSDLKPIEAEDHNGKNKAIEEEDMLKGRVAEVDGLGVDVGKEEKYEHEVLTEKESAKAADTNLQTREPLQDKSEEQTPQEGEIVPLDQSLSEAHADKQGNSVKSEDEKQVLREQIAKRQSSFQSIGPEKHMQMRYSYAAGSNAGEKEVEVIGTREITKRPPSKLNLPTNCRYSCRELGDVDHEGWLSKKGGGAFFSSWKRKWVVLKERHLYYYKTSFDVEAGGVVFLDEKRLINEAPELKRKYAFKIDCVDPKAQKLFLAADTKEEMDKWLSVLSAARRGEVIVRKTSQQVTDNVKMRKKSSSVNKRCGSVLGVSGLYEYNGNMENSPPTLRPASFGLSLNEKQKSLSLAVLVNEYKEAETKESDKPARFSDLPTTALQEGESEVSVERTDGVADEKYRDIVTTIEATEVDEVLSAPLNAPVGSDLDEALVAPVSLLSVERPCSDESVSTEEEINIAPLVEVVKTTGEAYNQSEETNEKENPKEDGAGEISQSNESEESRKEIRQSEEGMIAAKPEASQSNESTELVKSSSVSKSDRTSNTTWFLVLDAKNDVWVEYKFKPKNNDDELLSLVKTIKDARITITGTPLPGNEERGRAMTLVSPKNAEILKLSELKRSLKSKEKDLKAVDELLNQEIDRQSLHEWSTRYSYLTDDLSQETLEDAQNTDSDDAANAKDNDSSVKNDSAILKEEEKDEDISFNVKESESLESNDTKNDFIKEENFQDESNKGSETNEECEGDRKTCSEDTKMTDEKDELSGIEQGEFACTNIENNEELTTESSTHDDDLKEENLDEENFDTKL